MLFGRRDKKNQPSERVLNLKARVDALRQADEASRNKSERVTLDHFLEGDDVLTGRDIEDRYQPSGLDVAASVPAEAADPHVPATPPQQHSDNSGVDFEAELQRYLQRQAEMEALEKKAESPAPVTPPQPRQENTSLLLDGTWSHDDVVPPPRTVRDAWQNSDSPWTAAPADAPGSNAGPGWPASPDTAWQVQPEEEWPPRNEAV